MPLFLRRSRVALAGIVAVAALIAGAAHGRGTQSLQDTSVPALQDINGRRYPPPGPDAGPATVFLFWSTACPACSRYIGRISAVAAAYSPQKVRFFLVFSGYAENAAGISKYLAAHHLAMPALLDRGNRVATWLRADTTPETAIVTSSVNEVYRGRIDDNVNESAVLSHDLKNALAAVLQGNLPVAQSAAPIGCRIPTAPRAVVDDGGPPVTWSHDVAPIIYQNCLPCHRAGEIAPYPLETYRDAKQLSAGLRYQVTSHSMPPWKAVGNGADFEGARGLSRQQIDILARWCDTGAKLGSAAAAPHLPVSPARSKWSFGRPDLALSARRAYNLGTQQGDIYREFVLPVVFGNDTYLSGIDIAPDNRAVVHHAIVYLDTTGTTPDIERRYHSDPAHAADTEPGYSADGISIGVSAGKALFIAGWAIGNTPSPVGPGTAIKIPAGSRLVLQVHYYAKGAPASDQTQVGLHYATGAIDKLVQFQYFRDVGLSLAPGGSHQLVSQTLPPLAEDMHITSIGPHMHLLGRSMKTTAQLPGGRELPLLDVEDWDFNWQETYTFKTPVGLPKNTRLRCDAVYDNSDWSRQPTRPPKRVCWGEKTTDEMFFEFFTLTKDNEHLALKLGPPDGVYLEAP